MDRIDFGKVTGDIGFRMTAAATGTFLAAAAVIVPNDTQKKAAALQMYDKPWGSLEPTERKAAEYAAGLKRWNSFVNGSIYSWTRKLPGADTPFVNPYKSARVMRQAQQKVAADMEAAQQKEQQAAGPAAGQPQ